MTSVVHVLIFRNSTPSSIVRHVGGMSVAYKNHAFSSLNLQDSSLVACGIANDLYFYIFLKLLLITIMSVDIVLR